MESTIPYVLSLEYALHKTVLHISELRKWIYKAVSKGPSNS